MNDPGNHLALSPEQTFLLEAEGGKRFLEATRRRKKTMKRNRN